MTHITPLNLILIGFSKKVENGIEFFQRGEQVIIFPGQLGNSFIYGQIGEQSFGDLALEINNTLNQNQK